MAEERRERPSGRPDERPAEATVTPAAPVVKKKKKRSKLSMLFVLLLLALGVGTGLHFSGIWDARPLVWEAVPQIPYIGKDVADFFGIPEQYTLTVEERRAYELNQRQEELDRRERDLLSREGTVETVSADMAARSQILDELEAAAQDDEARRAENAGSEAERDLIAQRIRDFNAMAPRNAAQIAEQMAENLAVQILQGLNNDARTSILARMEPRKAARLVELMSIQ